MGEGTYSAEHVEVLLRCPVCLDRFNSPKILPCQHTFCKSPCLEGLIDFMTRKVKCPECRKEHVVSRSGADGFPTNITVSGFLDLQAQAAASQQQPSSSPQQGAVLRPGAGTQHKCGVCETEAETAKCLHCNKLVCQSCRRSHASQMKFDVGRLINQIRRGIPKLSGIIAAVEDKSEQSKQQVEGVKGEVKSTIERYIKELRDREKLLNSELETFLQGQLRSLRLHQENLEVELASVSSYCDSMEGLLNQASVDIPEADMVDMKRQCTEYMEQIRNAENNPLPELRQVTFRFDGNALQREVSNLGDVAVVAPGTSTARTDSYSRSQGRVTSTELQQGSSSSTRSRWSDPHPVDAVYLSGIASNMPATPEVPYLSHREVTPRLISPAGPAHGSHRLPEQSPTNTVRNRHSDSTFYESLQQSSRPTNRTHSSLDYTLGGPFSVSQATHNSTNTAHHTAPRSWASGVNWQNYMYRMDTSTDGVSGMLQELHGESRRSRSRRSEYRNNGALFGTSPFSVEDRPSGFMTGSGSGGSNSSNGGGRVTSTPAAASFVVSAGTRRGRGRSNRGQRPSRADIRRSAAAAAIARAAETGEQRQNVTTATTTTTITSAATSTTATAVSTAITARTSPGAQAGPNAGRTNTQNGETGALSGTGSAHPRTHENAPVLQRQGTFTREGGPSNAEVLPPTVPSDTGNNASAATSDLSPNSTLQDLDIDANVPDVPISASERAVNERVEHYQRKGQMLLKIGGQRGNEHSKFNCPRGVAVSPINKNIVIADSSNHRVQIFDSRGQFVLMFGSYGQGDGEFDCLAGVAVNTMGQIIIADRYNHRIQVFDQQGHFLHKFGSEGTRDGQLKYPWGVAVDSSGFIYVCDKENHRIQVFQQNGVFVRKFGGLGSNLGQLENPHYVAISADHKVIVSDTNNHRIQIFHSSGRLLQAFGLEGSGHGKMNHPKGVAVDDRGFIVVADSRNKRVQVHRPNGAFACCFGGPGSRSGHFRGLEGVSLLPNGTIAVCDRDNHRIQLF